MEVFFGVFAVLFVIGLPVMMIVALYRLGNLQNELSDLKRIVGGLREGKMKATDAIKVVRKECCDEPAPRPESVAPTPVAPTHTVMDIFWRKIEDWLAVRGEFAPKGVTHEFAFATRWLVRIGALLLVGATAYFLMLAIDRGWIGPAQRVYGMMAWGVAGTGFGAWLKQKSERYAILGEVLASLGLVAAYLSFGLGHRFFDPPVIASGYVAFAGLFAATVAAGFLSVRLRSLMIACLALVGGLLVPMICSFTNHDAQLHVYLFVLSLGACAVALLRGWTAYGFAAIAFAALFSHWKCGVCVGDALAVAYLFHAFEFALFLALAVKSAIRGGNAARALCWAAVTIAGMFCLCKTSSIIDGWCVWHGAMAIHHLGWAVAFAVLAVMSRRHNWGGTPVLVVFSSVSAAFALGSACIEWWHMNDATVVLLFCVFIAILADLGARCRDKSLQVLSLIGVIALSVIGFGRFSICASGDMGYARELVDRIQCLWSIPALVWFVGWRLGAPGSWMEGIRRLAFAVVAGMAFVVLTVESHFFGREFLPFLRGGFVTVVWTVVASSLLAAGIVRRVKAMRLWGLGLLAVSVVKLWLVDTSSLATPGRVGVFAAVGVLLIAGAFLYLKFKSFFEEDPE